MDFTYTLENGSNATVIKLAGTLTDKAHAAALLQDVDRLIAEGKNRFVLSLGQSK